MTQDLQTDPHSVYAGWRRDDPVHPVTLADGRTAWRITRYADARAALGDPRLSKASPASSIPADGIGAALSRHMLAVDPPDHTRLRRLVSTAFTARRIELLRPRIEKITDDLLDAMTEKSQKDATVGEDAIDFIDAFAFPLPIQVICELLGIPSEDRDAFRRWSTALVTGAVSGAELAEARTGIVSYIRTLVADRRTDLGGDLISALIDVRDSADRLSEDELISMIFLLLIAGHETTVNLLANGTFLLLSKRERWETLRAGRSLIPGAVEEFLRYESPVETATYRVATEDLEVGGRLIRAGDPVFIVLLSANRDDHFPDADELRLDRPQNAHLAFGYGIHYCIGAPLARLEAQIAFDRLLDRFPGMRMAVPETDLEWRPGMLIRGLQTLPVLLH